MTNHCKRCGDHVNLRGNEYWCESCWRYVEAYEQESPVVATEMNKPQTMEEQARARVAQSPELAVHAETIFYDWTEGEAHFEWIVTAPIAEIVDWAEVVELASESDE